MDGFVGEFQLLKADDGPVPADAWALATARHIMPISPTISPPSREIKARALQAAIAAALIDHHTDVQTREQDKLAAAGADHLGLPHDHDAAASTALATIVAAAKGTEWEAHFAKPEVQAIVAEVITSHFATSAHVERRWWCHRNPGDARGAAFLAANTAPGA